MSIKHATTRHPVHQLVAQRWSPYAYSDRSVDEEDLRSLFEAASWAASSYNEQPWRYIVARREDEAEFERLLSCLVEANQAWAKAASALALGIVSQRFTRNDKPNKAAEHDLGLAAGNLCFEATARGITVHQMIGIEPERARQVYSIPDGFEALTGIAIGYPAPPEQAPDALRERDLAPRSRKPLSELVFGGEFGRAAFWL